MSTQRGNLVCLVCSSVRLSLCVFVWWFGFAVTCITWNAAFMVYNCIPQPYTRVAPTRPPQLYATDHHNLISLDLVFYAPGLKGPPGASSSRIVRLSVCPFVCPFVCLSVIPSRLQTKCNNLSLADDKVTKLGL